MLESHTAGLVSDVEAGQNMVWGWVSGFVNFGRLIELKDPEAVGVSSYRAQGAGRQGVPRTKEHFQVGVGPTRVHMLVSHNMMRQSPTPSALTFRHRPLKAPLETFANPFRYCDPTRNTPSIWKTQCSERFWRGFVPQITGAAVATATHTPQK